MSSAGDSYPTVTPTHTVTTTSGLSEARRALGGSSHTSGLSLAAYLQKIKRKQNVLSYMDSIFAFFIGYEGGKCSSCGYIRSFSFQYHYAVSPFPLSPFWWTASIWNPRWNRICTCGALAPWMENDSSLSCCRCIFHRDRLIASVQICAGIKIAPASLTDGQASEFISALSKLSMERCPLGRDANLMPQDNKEDKSRRRRTQTTRDSCQQTVLLTSFAWALVSF